LHPAKTHHLAISARDEEDPEEAHSR
jgi:hypothetical protein